MVRAALPSLKDVSKPRRGGVSPARSVGCSLPAVCAGTTLARMENEFVKRLMWSGLLAGVGALASMLTQRSAALIWRRVFDEEPPE